MARRAFEVFVAWLMIAYGLFLAWRVFFDPTYLPDAKPPVLIRQLTVAEFLKLSSTNLNTASRDQLMELPGIGEVLADRIIEYRIEHDGFTSVEELLEVYGIGEKRLEDLRKYVYVE